MAGLVPAIHALARGTKDVDARIRGHDEARPQEEEGFSFMPDALSLPIADIALRLRDGRLTARALAEEAIANHERCGKDLLAYSQWAPEQARKCADAADAAFAVGAVAGPLQGNPVSVKDLFAMAGFPTFAGSPRRLPQKFETEGPVVAGLRRQLATLMGKTHMVEFAFGGTGHNAHYRSEEQT